MRYALTFGLLAVFGGFLTCQADSPVFSLITGYWAVSFGTLGIFYALRPSLKWVKSPSGQIPPLGFCLFAPYFLLAQFVLQLRARCETRASFSEIAPGLFLGRRPFGFDREVLEKLNIRAILDLTWEFGANQKLLEGRSYLSLPVLDGTAPTDEQFAEALRWLDEQADRTVLVHCALGNSRSASVLCVILLARGMAAKPVDAVRLVKSKRPSVGLNREQFAALEQFSNG